MTTETKKVAPAVLWVPSSYLAMGFVLCSLTLSNTYVFKNLGLPNGTITMLAAILTLPYVFKFLWAPLLELYKTKKFFVVLMQLGAAGCMALAGLALRLPAWLAVSFGAMFICSLMGATIDIGTDGVYVTTLDDKQKARWAGIQSMAWTGGQLLAQGALVWFAGKLHDDYGYTWKIAWMYVFLAAAVILAGLAAWHGAFMPPGAKAKDAPKSMGEAMAGFGHAYKTFFQKQFIWRMLALAFFYRFSWYLIEKVNNLFLVTEPAKGGLGLSNKAAAVISGGWGAVSFLAASVVGGLVLARIGLSRKTLMLFVGVLVIPNLAFLWLASSSAAPGNFWLITAVYYVAMYAYGFGAVAHMYYMMKQISPGPYQTAHYAFATGTMGLCNFLTGFFSGKIEEALGYQTFFAVVLFLTIPGLLAAWFAPFIHPMDEGFAKSPALAKPVGKVRNPWLVFLFGLLTLGIYRIYYCYCTFEEVRNWRGKGWRGDTFLIFLLTPVISVANVALPWLLPAYVGRMYAEDGQAKPITGLVGFWAFLPVVGDIVWLVSMQKHLNRFWISKGATT